MKYKSRLSKVFLIGILFLLICIHIHSNPYFVPKPNHNDTSCRFINTAPANNTDYVWNFGDGTIMHDTLKISPVHKYASPGFYSVCIVVADSSEPVPVIDTTCQLIEILDVNRGCFADFSCIFINEYKIKLNDSSTGDYEQVLWEFGDGRYSTEKNSVVHTYDEPGYYDVKLSILDDDLNIQSRADKSIIVAEDDIIVDAYFTDSLNSFDKNTIFFTNLSSQSKEYLWDLDDGTITTEENPVHYYQTPGIYNVKLTVYDTVTGKMDNYKKQVYVNLMQLEIKSDFECYPDIENKRVYFHDFSTGDQIEHYLWDFGDGETSTDQNPVHQYAENGIYDVCLSTWNYDTALYNTFCREVKLIDSTGNFADFNCYPDSSGIAKFNNISRGDSLLYFWDFGDSTFSSETNPVHTYIDTGIYVVHLTATYEDISFHQFKIVNFQSRKKSLIGGIGLIVGDDILKSFNTKIKPKGLISGDISKFFWKYNNSVFNTISLSPLALDIDQPDNQICLELFNNTLETQCIICRSIYFENPGYNRKYSDENHKISIFPNPANDYINIEYMLEDNENAYIDIIELTGRILKRISVDYNQAGKNIIKVNCNDLGDGMYYIRLVTGKSSEVLKISVLN